jgi:cbb3-type cytochrome oxidase maturation protein
MEVLYLLVPLAVVLVIAIVWAFFWSIRSGQFDDLEGPAHRILMDRDDDPPDETSGDKGGESGK